MLATPGELASLRGGVAAGSITHIKWGLRDWFECEDRCELFAREARQDSRQAEAQVSALRNPRRSLW